MAEGGPATRRAAGGAEKCRFAVEALGFDAWIDHRAPGLAAALAGHCPKGIDVYLENVGGAVFDAVLPLPNARRPLVSRCARWHPAAHGRRR